MKLNDIYPMISSHRITLYDITTNKVHTITPESTATLLSTIKTLSEVGDYEVSRIIPLDYQHLQITLQH